MTGRKHTIPDALRHALIQIGETQVGSPVDNALLSRAAAEIDALDPRRLPEAERTFATLASLHGVYWVRSASFLPAQLASRLFGNAVKMSRVPVARRFGLLPTARHDGAPDIAALAQQPALAPIFLRHRSGYVREAALKAFEGRPVSPFVFASIVYRLNDWIPQVRAAATATLERIAPCTPPSVIAEAAPTLIVTSATWGRWSGSAAMLDLLFERPEVIEALADRLAAPPSGGEVALLRRLLRRPAIDQMLPRLASDAYAPSIRAIASEALIRGAARWPEGWREYWVDKVYGVKGYEPLFETRPLTIAPQMAAALDRAARDRSPAVRKIAADALIRGFPDTVAADAATAHLKSDPSPSVRDRIAFVLRQQSSLA